MKLSKSPYSYDQYHWWPIALIVVVGLTISSIAYRRRIDGSASMKRMIAGIIVHRISNKWFSSVVRAVFFERVTTVSP